MSGGLGNVGNTCYVNTTLQCMGHCSTFLKYVLDPDHKKEDNLMCQAHELFHELYVNKSNVIPKKFLRYLREYIRVLEVYQQNDINEFIAAFIDKLNQQVCKRITVTQKDLIKKHNYTSSDFDIQRFKMDMAWYEKTGKEYSPLIPIFHGQTISQIICGNCDKIFHNYEIYCNLMLPMTETTNTIYDCFDEYFKDETINSEEKLWTCDKCNTKSPSVKTTKLWRNPHVLIVSLKRFTHDLNKNNKPVEIPEVLNLSKHALTNEKNKYALKSVAHHYGSSQSGHYFANCKDNTTWTIYDDLDVKPNTQANHANGYVFFYEAITE